MATWIGSNTLAELQAHEARRFQRCAGSASGRWMRVTSAAIRPAQWNAQSWWLWLRPNSPRSNALCSSSSWNNTLLAVFKRSSRWADFAGLRISEIAALRVDQCHINQRSLASQCCK